MSACEHYPYTLPAIDFVGGSNQDLAFHVFFFTTKNPYDLANCTANFAIVSFRNKNGETILSKEMAVAAGQEDYQGDTYSNILKVSLTSAETVNLSGKYIYQISIREKTTGKTEVPNQGVLYVTNNINKRYITS